MNGFGPITAVTRRNSKPLIEVALGKAPADLVIINARLVNVYTAEILERYAVGVKGEWIAYVGETPEALIGPDTKVIDAAGKFLLPGLIEGHTHLAWLFGIDEFLKYAIPGGATTIITETLEPYPVCGINGVLDFLSSLQDQPIKIFSTAPAMVSISEKSLGIPPNDLETLLNRDDILGIGESYWQGILQTPEEILPQFKLALQKGKVLEGHSAGARHHKLMAYAACGISSCHEPITAEETLERLRLGIYVMAREGSIRRDLKTISEIKDKKVDLRRLILSTDGVTPGELMEKGFLEYVVKRAIGYGFDPVSAVQMVTINVAEHFKIDHLVGGIAPGKYADMLILPDFSSFSPEWVISCGKIIAQQGKLTATPRKHRFSDESKHSIRLSKPVKPEDFVIRVPSGQSSIKVRVIEMVTDLVTAEKIVTVPVKQEELLLSVDQDLLKVAAIDRTHCPGNLFTGLIQGFGLTSGAIACSAAWDTSDIIIVGANDADMALAVNRIIALQGAAVLCRNGVIVAELALPIFGIISEAPMEEIAAKVKGINEAAKALGVPFPDPLLTLITLTGAAIPYYRICDEGLVNLKFGRMPGLFPDNG